MGDEYLEPQLEMAVEWPMPFKIKEAAPDNLEAKSSAASKATLAVPQVLNNTILISGGFHDSISKKANPSNGSFNDDESHLKLTHITKKPSFISTDITYKPANPNTYIINNDQIQLGLTSGASKVNQVGSISNGEKLHFKSTGVTQSISCNAHSTIVSNGKSHDLAFNTRRSHSKFKSNAQSLPFSPLAAFNTSPVVINKENIGSSKFQDNDQFNSEPAFNTQAARSIISPTIIGETVGFGSVLQYDSGASDSVRIAQSVPYTRSPAARIPFVSKSRSTQHLETADKTVEEGTFIFGSDSDCAVTASEGPSIKNDELSKEHQTAESSLHTFVVPALTAEKGVEEAEMPTTSESRNPQEKDNAMEESILSKEDISNLERGFKHSTIHASKHHLMHYLFPAISALRPDVAVDIADKFMTINSKKNIIAMINDPELFNIRFAEYSQEYDLPVPRQDLKLRMFLNLVSSRAHRDQAVRDYFIERVLEFQDKVPAKLVESFCAWGDEDLVYLFGDRLKFVDTISDFTWSMDDE